MSFAIAAEFPLGTYRAGIGEGQLDRWPSPARLHAALLAAAGQGVRAEERAGHLEPSTDDVDALTWLENHPPDGLALPTSHVNHSSNAVYRDLGLRDSRQGGTKRVPKRDHANVALHDGVVWVWEQPPPSAVREVLEDLCGDVPYLGRSDSPVRLRVVASPATVNHRRDAEARASTRRPGDVELAGPREGRTDALRTAHRDLATAAAPSERADRSASAEDESRTAAVTVSTQTHRYVPVDRRAPKDVPWDEVWIVPFADGTPRIEVDDRVRWCVALHRALISLHGDDAPAVLTGRYAEQAERPANRIALQVMDESAAADEWGGQQAFVVAVPSGCDPADVAAVSAALARLRVVRSRGAEIRLVPADDRPRPRNGDTFWRPVDDQLVRAWVTAPAVPETRPPSGGTWSMEQVVALSLAHVFRSTFVDDAVGDLPRDMRWRELAARVTVSGVDVLAVRKLAPDHVERYVHKVAAGLVVQPYVATMLLGELPDQAWVAIGQSRHLGGGLLMPVDVQPAIVDLWRQR